MDEEDVNQCQWKMSHCLGSAWCPCCFWASAGFVAAGDDRRDGRECDVQLRAAGVLLFLWFVPLYFPFFFHLFQSSRVCPPTKWGGTRGTVVARPPLLFVTQSATSSFAPAARECGLPLLSAAVAATTTTPRTFVLRHAMHHQRLRT